MWTQYLLTLFTGSGSLLGGPAERLRLARVGVGGVPLTGDVPACPRAFLATGSSGDAIWGRVLPRAAAC